MKRLRNTARSWIVALGAVALLSVSAFALDLNGAKSQGLIGERADGYVGAVAGSPSPDVAALVKSINSKRTVAYQDIATKTGAPIDAVAARAGKKLIGKAGAGEWTADASGKWSQK